MALLDIDPHKSIGAQLTGLDDTPDVIEANYKAERTKSLRQAKLDYLTNSMNTKMSRFGYDVDKGIQENLSDAVNEQVYTNADGSMYQMRNITDERGNKKLVKEPFAGNTRTLYISNTADGDMKLGLARDDTKRGISPFSARYMDKTESSPYTGSGGMYDGTPGPLGVDAGNKPLMEIRLPYDYATQFEYGVHSDIDQIKNRSIGSGAVIDSDTLGYGAGKTEYTKPTAPIWDDRVIRDNSKFITKNTPLPLPLAAATFDKYYKQNNSIEAPIDDSSTLNKIAKAAAAGLLNMGSTLAQTGASGIKNIGERFIEDAYKPINSSAGPFMKKEEQNKYYSKAVDYIGKELKDFGTKLEKEQADARSSGVFEEFIGYDPRQVEAYGNLFKDNVKKGEYLKSLKDLAVDPESATIALGNSLPEMMFMVTGVGLAAMTTANVNTNLYALTESAAKEGKVPTTGQKAVSVAMSVVGTLLDRLGDKAVLGDNLVSGQIKGVLLKTISNFTPEIKDIVLKTAGDSLKRLGVTSSEFAGRTAVEGATEGIQTILENKASDIKNLNIDLTEKEIDEALVATGIGMGAGGVATTGSMSPKILSTVVDTTKDVAAISGMLKPKPTESVDTKTYVKDNTATLDSIASFYDKSQTAEGITGEELIAMESTLASLDKSKLDKANKTKIDEIESKINNFYETKILNNDEDIVLGSKEDLLKLFSKAGIKDTEQFTEIDNNLFNRADKAGILEGKTNDEKISSYNKIKKDYFTVEQEATVGRVGYITLGKELDSLTNAISPNKELINRKIQQMRNFEQTQKDYLSIAKPFYDGITRVVKTYNESKDKSEKILANIITEARNGVSVNKGKDKFNITVKRDDNGKAVIPAADSIQSMIFDAKARNIEGINKELTNASSKLKTLGIDIAAAKINTDPIIEIKDHINQDLKRKLETARDVILELKDKSPIKSVKIITNKGKSSYTDVLTKDNADITNTNNYTKGDNVFVTMSKENKEDFAAVSEEISTAVKSGATIHIDESLSDRAKMILGLVVSNLQGSNKETSKPKTVAEKPAATVAKEEQTEPVKFRKLKTKEEKESAEIKKDIKQQDKVFRKKATSTEKYATIKETISKEKIKGLLSKIVELKEKVEKSSEEVKAKLIEAIQETLGSLYEGNLATKAIENRILAGTKNKFMWKNNFGQYKQGDFNTEFKSVPVDLSLYVNSTDLVELLTTIDPDILVGKEYYSDIYNWLVNTQKATVGKSGKILDNETTKREYYDSPAKGLVLDIEGNVNKTVALAMKLAFDEYVTYSSDTLSKYKSKEEIANMLGILESQLTKEMYSLIKDKGMFKKTAINKIGASVMQKLGYTFNKNAKGIEKEAYDRLQADLGNMVILAMSSTVVDPKAENIGLIVIDDSITVERYAAALEGREYNPTAPETGATETFIRLNDAVYTKTIDTEESILLSIKENYKKIHTEVGDAETIKRGFKTTPIKQPRFRKEQVAKDIVGMQIPKGKKGFKSPVEFLEKMVSMVWSPNIVEMNQVVDMWNNSKQKPVLLDYLGFKTEEQLGLLSLDSRESTEANNRAILESVETVVELAEAMSTVSAEKAKKMYFDWYYTSNGRYMLDSNTINPQTNKLHRFLVQPVGHKKVYSVKNGKVYYKGKNLTTEFKYALAQSFGYAVDKKSTISVIEFADKLLELNTKTLEKAILSNNTKYFERHGITVEHISHTLQGLNVLKQISTGAVETSLTAEFDAVTSGFGLKLLQLPIVDNLWTWLNRVGIFNKSSKTYSSMNDQLDLTNMYDSYQSLAVDIDISDRGDTQPTKLKKELWNIFEATLPKVIKDDVNTVISKEIRNLFKYPFMTFNYSASITTIKRNLANELMYKVLDGITSKNPAYMTTANYLGNKLGKDENIIELLKVKDPSMIKIADTNVEEILMEMFEDTYGSEIERIMNQNFGEFIRANATINTAFKVVFDLFNDAYLKEKSKYPVGTFKEKEFMEVMKKLRPIFPMIKGPLSEDTIDGIAVYNTSSTTPTEANARYTPAQTQTGIDEENKRTSKARYMIRDFEAAINAGSVIPIHYLDGALMAQLAGYNITAIHDAIMPELDQAIATIKAYNTAMLEVSMQYDLVGEIMAMLDTARKNLDMSPVEFIKAVNSNTNRVRLWSGEKEKIISTKNRAGVLQELKILSNKVKVGRKEIQDNVGVIGHMAGLPGSMYKVDETMELMESTEKEIDTEVATDDSVQKAAYDTVSEDAMVANEAKTMTDKEYEANKEYVDKWVKDLGIKVIDHGWSEYIPSENTIHIKRRDNIKEEIAAMKHEITHAVVYSTLNKGIDSTTKKYLLDTLEDILLNKSDDISDDTLDRIAYARTGNTETLDVLSEILAVIGTEKSVREELLDVTSKDITSNEFLKALISFIRKVVGNDKLFTKSELLDTVDKIIKASEGSLTAMDKVDFKEISSIIQKYNKCKG